jgi:hypothetical protein
MCAAKVTGDSSRFRASESVSPLCQREASLLISGKWFCYQHAPAWRMHYEIVERIRSIPIRDAI